MFSRPYSLALALALTATLSLTAAAPSYGSINNNAPDEHLPCESISADVLTQRSALEVFRLEVQPDGQLVARPGYFEATEIIVLAPDNRFELMSRDNDGGLVADPLNRIVFEGGEIWVVPRGISPDKLAGAGLNPPEESQTLTAWLLEEGEHFVSHQAEPGQDLPEGWRSVQLAEGATLFMDEQGQIMAVQ